MPAAKRVICVIVLFLTAVSQSWTQEIPKPGDVLIADFDGHPHAQGGLTLWHAENQEITEFYVDPVMKSPQGLRVNRFGHAVFADVDADSVFDVDLVSGDLRELWRGSPLANPSGLVVLRSGNILVCDWDADPAGYGNSNGAVFYIPREGGGISTFAADPVFRRPFDLSLSPSGKLAMIDSKAQPVPGQSSTGAILILDPSTGQVLDAFTHPDMRNPEGLTFDGDDKIIVADRSARSFGTEGTIFETDLVTRETRPIAGYSQFDAPRRVIIGPDGNYLVAGGQLWVVDRSTHKVTGLPGSRFGPHVGMAVIPDAPPFAPGPVLGDVNTDGKIDNADSQLILNWFAGKNVRNFEPSAADMDGDGEIDNADAQIVMQIFAG